MENIEICILLGFPGTDDLSLVLNFCCFLAKKYIYNIKIQENNKICLFSFLTILNRELQYEKQICIKK